MSGELLRREIGMAGAGAIGAWLGLAFWVETAVWLIGLALIAAGLGWHEVRRRNPGVAS